MKFQLLTLFPAAFGSALGTSVFGRAIEAGRIEVEIIDIRDFASGKHREVDDSPYGGGAGMVMKVEPLHRAIVHARDRDPATRVILLCPQGARLDQPTVVRLAGMESLSLICGRYEGVDERVRSFVDEELSVGDYVLSGGEPAAWVVMDAIARWVPGVLGRDESAGEESFGPLDWLEYPQYTRPRVYEGMQVPEVLLGGDHAAIERWRKRQALLRTMARRPDLIDRAELTDEERAWLEEDGI
ncbi:MAG: tRNA (guanosine(37)-N1)-methyltransferase TrmD [Deltaproteobacteria bacterium]|nr:tRNA (guanosine(37)-N1)-methyltransferase TrmD [Deltaproteobacteria bacterium]